MPEIKIVNKSNQGVRLIGSALGVIPKRSTKLLTVSADMLEQLRPHLEKLRNAGFIDYETDEDAKLASKAREIVHSAVAATSLSSVLRVDADTEISCSSTRPSEISDCRLVFPHGGYWLITFEGVVHSPHPAAGAICLIRGATEVPMSRREWKRSREELKSSMYTSAVVDVKRGEVLSGGWLVLQGSLRMENRSITAMKVNLPSHATSTDKE